MDMIKKVLDGYLNYPINRTMTGSIYIIYFTYISIIFTTMYLINKYGDKSYKNILLAIMIFPFIYNFRTFYFVFAITLSFILNGTLFARIGCNSRGICL